jgi:hypothetical protein
MLKQQTALIAQICRDAGFDAIGNQHGIVSVGLKNRAVKPIELESVLSDELDNELVRLEYLPRIGKTAVIVNA